MSFTERFNEAYRLKYSDQAQMAIDHHQGYLRPFVTEQTCEGTQAQMFIEFDSKKAQRREGRAPTNRDDPTNRRARWLKYPGIWDTSEYIDSEDTLKATQDFQSTLMTAQAEAMQRSIDEDIILAGIFGDAYEGELGTGAITLPATQLIAGTVQEGAGTAGVGLNLRKLRSNRLLFAGHKIDLQANPIVCPVTAEQIDDLGDEIKLTNADYRADAAPMFNREGKLTMVWNHVFVEYQNLQTKQKDFADGNGIVTVQRVPTWIKSAVRLGVWMEVRPRQTFDSSKYDTPFIWNEMSMDCRRGNEKGVSEIECVIG